MENELSTLDQYLTDPSWGKSNVEETNNRKIRRNLLTNEELACDQDDLGNFVSIWDHVYLIHLSKRSRKPEYIYVIEDGLIDALEEYDRDNLIDISYYGPVRNTLLKWRQNLMSEGTKRNDNKLFNSLYKITVNDVVEKETN